MILTEPKISRSLLMLAALLCSATMVIAVPSRPRTIKKLSRPNEPVTIIAVKVNGKPVEFGKAFPGRNDWLGSLTFVIKNTSAKPVSWARVALIFNKKEGGSTLHDFATYGIGRWDEDKLRGGGPPLKPGETAEASYSLAQYQSIRDILNGLGYPQSIVQIEVTVDQVIFEDQPELMWIEGTMNEFHSPTGWRPVKP